MKIVHRSEIGKLTFGALALRQSEANARNVSFPISVRWSIYIINSVNKPNFRVSLPHRRSTTVSIETNPLYSLLAYFANNIECEQDGTIENSHEWAGVYFK